MVGAFGMDGRSAGAVAQELDRVKRELAVVEARLRAAGALPELQHPKPRTSRRSIDGDGDDDDDAPDAAPSTTTLADALGCRALIVSLPVSAIAALQATSRLTQSPFLAPACWRLLYHAAFPYELPKREAAESSHPLPAPTWKRLYLERQLDGTAAVPCFLLDVSAMASATLDPGAMRLAEGMLLALNARTSGYMHAWTDAMHMLTGQPSTPLLRSLPRAALPADRGHAIGAGAPARGARGA